MESGWRTLFRSATLCGLSLSLGWGIRGNFGHAHGAMIPGALAALAAVLVSDRQDWWRRSAYFAMFGAIGWAFGGRMSYMQVIAYTHSGHAPSQLYGFACLCVIGFLWAFLGGAWTALPACLDRDRLTRLVAPVLAVLAAWFVKNLVLTFIFPQPDERHRHESRLYWYDTSWLDALVALCTLAACAATRPRCWAPRFLLYLAVGWWVSFLAMVLLVDGFGINFRMTPPRGDDWAGTLGMAVGALVYFSRHGLVPGAGAALITGSFGGAGFAAATFLKLVEVAYVPAVPRWLYGEPNWQTNWHSVLEQTYGLFNGIGVGVAMHWLARRVPPVADEPRVRLWTEVAAAGLVLVLVTYINLATDVPNWVQQNAVPAVLYRLPARVWFDVGYAVLAAALLALLARHLRRPLVVLPASPLGKGQLLYIVFLWWVVAGNLMHAIPPFGEQRLITEGVIHVNAVCCTVLVLVWGGPGPRAAAKLRPVGATSLAGIAAAGLLGLGLVTVGAFYGTRAIYGDHFAGFAGKHYRFGPNALPPRPKAGEEHP